MSKFDLVTHTRNEKGRITNETPYRLVIESGEKKFERPVGSGQWFSENGKPLNVAVATEPAVVAATAPKKELTLKKE